MYMHFPVLAPQPWAVTAFDSSDTVFPPDRQSVEKVPLSTSFTLLPTP